MRTALITLAVSVAACAAHPAPAPARAPANLETRSALMRQELNQRRAEVMGSAFALMSVAQRCPDARLRANAAALEERIGAYYRALLSQDIWRARTFEAHARSMVTQLPPGPPTDRLCASITANMPATERVLAEAGG
jgi:hypothetical protein